MAWIEWRKWTVEQGIDALLELRLVANKETGERWDFTGWEAVGVVADEAGTESYECTIESEPANGILRFILLEADANALDPKKKYFFNGLLISPSPDLADDHHVAYLPVKVAPRPARRPGE